MTLKNVFIILCALTVSAVQAQKKDRILVTINNTPIYTSEFSKVYEKNIDLVTDPSQKNVTKYLDLFINYKLKLAAAYEMGLDTVSRYKRELASYKKQLSKPFLKDKKITNALVKEAYERTIKDVNVSHILIMVKQNALPSDTLKAYTKIMKARKELLSGKDFSAIAKKYSEDPSVKENGGNLGYFNAFRMVYPFETASYTTKKGTISKPFKTRFGYHIVKVNDIRPSKGEVEVAHIMLKGVTKENELKINKIYKDVLKEGKFEYYASKFSEDKASALKGGKLRKFSSGNMVKSFEDVAFALTKENEISKPFTTKYGYHIIKLLKKYEIPSFKALKPILIKKIEKDARSQLIANSLIDKLKKKFKITENTTLLDSIFISKKVKHFLDAPSIFKINDKDISSRAYLLPLIRRRATPNRANFEKFKNAQILTYYSDHLEKYNKEFAFILNEYKDGLLLFDLLQKKIWDASNDSIALQNYFAKHADQYKWNKRVKVNMAICKDLETAKNIHTFLTKGMTVEKISNSIDTSNIIFNDGVYEITSKQLPQNFIPKLGVSKIYKDNQHFVVVLVAAILPAQTKKLKEIKGIVISDFQKELEQNWIAELREKYSVKIDKKLLKKIVKKYAK